MWDFETEPEFQQQLDWIDDFVAREVEPLDHLLGSQWNIADPRFVRLVRPLQAKRCNLRHAQNYKMNV